MIARTCPFITTWKSDNPGGLTNQIIIPTLASSGPYNYDIYWESTTNAAVYGTIIGNTANTTVTFPTAGTYRVEISGDFPHFYMNNNTATRQKLLSVEKWGDTGWKSMASAFH
jgi:hypothetical protein